MSFCSSLSHVLFGNVYIYIYIHTELMKHYLDLNGDLSSMSLLSIRRIYIILMALSLWMSLILPFTVHGYFTDLWHNCFMIFSIIYAYVPMFCIVTEYFMFYNLCIYTTFLFSFLKEGNAFSRGGQRIEMALAFMKNPCTSNGGRETRKRGEEMRKNSTPFSLWPTVPYIGTNPNIIFTKLPFYTITVLYIAIDVTNATLLVLTFFLLICEGKVVPWVLHPVLRFSYILIFHF